MSPSFPFLSSSVREKSDRKGSMAYFFRVSKSILDGGVDERRVLFFFLCHLHGEEGHVSEPVSLGCALDGFPFLPFFSPPRALDESWDEDIDDAT